MTEIGTYEHHFVTNDGPIFNMIEDESGDVFWGYGHRDGREFIGEINRWLIHINAGTEPDYLIPLNERVEHLWASLEEPDGGRFRLVPACNDPEVFPVTRFLI
jgi:hypothetical protein